jgi:hypothetical protein
VVDGDNVSASGVKELVVDQVWKFGKKVFDTTDADL